MSQGEKIVIPVEHLHSLLIDAFHKRRNGEKLTVCFDGISLNKMIAECKTELYREYPEAREQRLPERKA